MSRSGDESLWKEYTQSVRPLRQRQTLSQEIILPKLKARKTLTSLINTLDLHGKTLQEAYLITKTFIDLHFQKQSRHIHIITGKGINESGKIKNEIEFWFETPVFQEKIHSYVWENNGGVLKIILKRRKK